MRAKDDIIPWPHLPEHHRLSNINHPTPKRLEIICGMLGVNQIQKDVTTLMWVCDISVGLYQAGVYRSIQGMCHTPVAFLNHKNVDENKMLWIDHGGIMWFPLSIVFGHH